jgi:hypothetical protein
MTTLSTRRLGYNDAVQFAEGFSEPAATVGYVVLGKNIPWDATDTPPAILDTDNIVYDVYESMIGAKKVTGNDVYLVIPRFNWTANTVYAAYDDRSDGLYSSINRNYVYSATGAVYRCIDNNNGIASTVEPTGDYTINSGFIQMADGYIWKYMYAIPPSNKFITEDWIPVPTAQFNSYYGSSNNIVEGAISRIKIESGGTGYGNTNTSIKIVGNGAGANATANVIGGVLVGFNDIVRGTNYNRQNCTITIVGSGTGANVRPIISAYGGHGFNPARELGANTVMIAVKVGSGDATEGGKITINNDFRQVSLLVGPHKYGQNTEISSANANSAVSLTTDIVITSGTDFTIDELVYQGTDSANSTFSGYVVDNSASLVKINEVRGTIQVGVNLKGNTSTVSRTVVNVTQPELQPMTGDLIYVENRTPVSRASNQAENIKFVVKF